MVTLARAARPLALAVSTLAAAAGLAAPQQTPPPPASQPTVVLPQGGPLIAPGASPDLALLYTGDVIGYLEPCG